MFDRKTVRELMEKIVESQRGGYKLVLV